MNDFKPQAPAAGEPMLLAMCCDGRYAMPLATTLRSMAESNVAHWPVEVHVLAEGFSPALQQKVAASLPHGSVALRWHEPDLSAYRHLTPQAGRNRILPTITYGRLLLPGVLPPMQRRVLYLDADILVLQDLQPLWNANLRGASVGAVFDGMDGARRTGAPDFEKVPPVQRYFNAGVLVMDLPRWRDRRIAERALQYLQANPDTPYSDQDALNVTCDGDWQPLDWKWNLQALYHRGELDRGGDRERPGIVHFITGDKPWIAAIPNRHARFYDAYRHRTQFARSPGERLHDGATGVWCRAKLGLKRVHWVRRALQRRRADGSLSFMPTSDRGPT